MYFDEEGTEFTRDGIKLLVEQQEGSLVITQADLDPEDTYHLAILLIDRLSKMVGQTYNGVLDDLKETGEEI